MLLPSDQGEDKLSKKTSTVDEGVQQDHWRLDGTQWFGCALCQEVSITHATAVIQTVDTCQWSQ